VLSESESAPSWVARALEEAPFVIVRRDRLSPCSIPVGVRGLERGQRWACSIDSQEVIAVIRPDELINARSVADPAREREIPALRQFRILIEKWERFHYRWGPFGSVSFELATGLRCCRPSSDLDLAIYPSRRIDLSFAAHLLNSLSDSLTRVDILVETSVGAFSLAEYARADSNRILLRTCNGSRLVRDPWSTET